MEKNVKVRLKLDYKAMKYYNMYNLLYRKHFVWVYVILIVVCVIGAIFSFLGDKLGFIKSEPNVTIAVIFALFAAYLVYQVLTLEKTIDRNITNYFYNHNPYEQDIVINDETITFCSVKDPSQTVVHDWLEISQIHEIKQYYYLFIGKRPIIIDRSPEAIIEGSMEDLDAIIQEKIAGKPYKKVTKEVVKKPITFVHQVFEEDQEQATEIDLEVKDAQPTEEATEIEVEVKDVDNKEEAGKEK